MGNNRKPVSIACTVIGFLFVVLGTVQDGQLAYGLLVLAIIFIIVGLVIGISGQNADTDAR